MGSYVYIGEPMLTRGEYGAVVTGAHDGVDPEHPDDLYVFDPDFGDRFMCIAKRASEMGFVPVSE